MIILSDSQFLDSNGRPLHGRALEVKQAAAVREREQALAEAERHLADREQAVAAARSVTTALARALVKLLARGPLSGPDALRSLCEDPEDAVVICEAAGLDPRAVRARWADAAPARPAQSKSDFWSQFPDHDPDFVTGRRPLADVAAEHAGLQLERQARQQSAVMWRTRDGGIVADGGAQVMGASFENGAPQQRSIVHTSVPEPGTE